ncbi:MAG: cell division protein FtsX [Gammaproteobacteria bacterium]|nr:cell division protein FtsX [Gammaproteobacteria bacterium]
MTSYLLRHLQVLFYSLGQLARTPFASLVTVAVIGISLALPAGLYVLLDNMQRVSGAWDGAAQLSVFLKRDVSERAGLALAQKIRARPEIASVNYISREAALAEFKRLSGFGNALNALDGNPLPAVLAIRPASPHADAATLARLGKDLQAMGEVELVQLDLDWIKRLNAILDLARHGVWLLATVLALALTLIVGNTIRLAVLGRRTEIEIIKLVGGTDAFIRRPFLYSGLLQGLGGALCAWALLALVLALLAAPVQELAALYGSRFELRGLDVSAGLALLALGALLGWLGSRLAVGRHLRAIEPR